MKTLYDVAVMFSEHSGGEVEPCRKLLKSNPNKNILLKTLHFYESIGFSLCWIGMPSDGSVIDVSVRGIDSKGGDLTIEVSI